MKNPQMEEGQFSQIIVLATKNMMKGQDNFDGSSDTWVSWGCSSVARIACLVHMNSWL